MDGRDEPLDFIVERDLLFLERLCAKVFVRSYGNDVRYLRTDFATAVDCEILRRFQIHRLRQYRTQLIWHLREMLDFVIGTYVCATTMRSEL